ncbi:MAG: hypothetical protein Q8L20_15395 [Gammaproteobacteria bacterium]|nr:hypothetical protein [Gammaproteobacteria bacterium]
MSRKTLYQPSDLQRQLPEPPQKNGLAAEPYRSDFRRDFARLIHSTSFRRLKGKMQLFPDSEGDYFRNRLTHSLEVDPFKTIECQIMDIADDIAYSTYDLDDALKSGLIRILDIISLDDSALTEIARKTNKAISANIGQEVLPTDVWEALISILESQMVLDGLKDRDPSESVSDLAYKLGALLRSEIDVGTQAYQRNQLTSHLVGEFIQAVQVRVAPGNDTVFAEIYLDKKVWIKIETLKHLAFHFLIHSPRWKVVARRAREIVTYLFDTLTADSGYELMPDDCKLLYQQADTKHKKYRVVCDFISCMTDTYAVEFYSRLKSDRPSSFFKPM